MQGFGYATIAYRGNQLTILNQNYGSIPLNESAALQTLTGMGTFPFSLNVLSFLAHLPPLVDHVLLARIYESWTGADLIVKMLMLSVTPNFVTFRYDILNSTTPASTFYYYLFK